MRRPVNEDEDAATRRWTYRGVGSDHEIVVRVRESTPTGSSDIGGKSNVFNEKIKSVLKESSEQLQCACCKRVKLTKDFWWCRTCQKTLCSSCNLLQGHTEHRTVPWRREELVRSLQDTVEARCTARTVRASEEEAAIKEYMREIENYFLGKLRQRLTERNDEDRDLMTAVSNSTRVTFADRKFWPPAIPAPPVASNGISTNLAQFSSLLTDDSLARLVKEIGNRLLPAGEDAKMLTVKKWPRMLGAATPPATSPSPSAMVNGKNEASSVDEDDEQRLLVSTQHFYSFAAVLPNVEPLEFAQMLEQQPGYSPRLRSRSQSTLTPRVITPSMERVHSRTHSPSRGLKEPSPLSIYGAVNVNGDNRRTPAGESHYANPHSQFVRGDYHRKSAPTSAVSTPRVQQSAKTRGQGAPMEETTRPEPTISTSLIQAEPPSRVPTSSDSRRRYSLPTRYQPAKGSSALADTSTESNADEGGKRQRQYSTPDGASRGKTTPVSVTAFHFGEEFLTRPIDVRPLDNDLLAVSDSCGGVYITDAKGGKILHNIWLDGNSASSLCYVPSFNDQPDRPPLLLVSVLGKSDRCVRFYDTNNFAFLDEIPCPTEPDIDLGRSRWLATDDQGGVYLTSGDGKVSALWKFHSSPNNPWTLLKEVPNSRYQYLDVMHHMADSTSVTLLTCNGIQGSLLMITVSRAGKILAEQDFTDSYGLEQYIHSPASAVVDHRGNMLILDYSNGKLWILKAPKGNRQGGDRRLKLLTEFGPQQAMGIAVTPSFWQSEQFITGEQWCYAACFNKKRVHAVKYLSD